MKKVLVILGPTATGKTDLALNLAKKLEGELVACDSRQVYKGLDIGTGKMPSKNSKLKKRNGCWIIDGVNIWMYDVADPNKQYSVANYVNDAENVVGDITRRGKLPIIVGGTGLYLKALIEGLSSLKIPLNYKLRRELSRLTLEELQERLKTLFSVKWKNLNQSDRKNKHRLIRAIELASANPYINRLKNSRPKDDPPQPEAGPPLVDLAEKYNTLKIGLTSPRMDLRQKIYNRLLARLEQGMIEEGERLHKKGLSFKRMKELGLEYKYLAMYLNGKFNKEEFIDLLNIKISQYAKRQVTWFKKERDVAWFDITTPDFSKDIERLVISWYNQG